MPLELDARIRQMIDAGAGPSGAPGFADLRDGDALALRAVLDDGLRQLSGLPAVDVSTTDHRVAAPAGHELALRWYRPGGPAPGSAVVYLHGGGMVAGSVDLYDPVVRTYVDWTGVPFLAVDYRLAPEAPPGGPAADALVGLRWLVERAPELGVDPQRIALMGDSAGGGVAAAAAVLARDAGVHVAKQILIYPMLDDRNTEPDPQVSAAPSMFSHELNRTAWAAVRRSLPSDEDLPAVAAPARATDLTGLAPAYIEVGELDIFRDEDVAYAQRLWRSGVSVELHVHPGYPHAFDLLLLGDEQGDRHKHEKIRILRGL